MGEPKKTLFNPIGRFIYTVDENGEYHSYNDKPAINYYDNGYVYMKHGVLHRDNGLTVKIDKWIEYYKEGVLHNMHGSAMRNTNNGYSEYYINGVKYDKFIMIDSTKLIHGVQTSYPNNVPTKEYWVHGKKADVDSIPKLMTTTEENKVYVLGYTLKNIDDYKMKLVPDDNEIICITLTSDHSSVTHIQIIQCYKYDISRSSLKNIFCLPFDYKPAEFLAKDIITVPIREPPKPKKKKEKKSWSLFN